MERPYIPFYKPYGMSDEEFEHERKVAEERLAEWEYEQEQQQIYEQEILMRSHDL